MISIFSSDSKTTVDKISLWKQRALSTVKKHKTELLFGIFLSSICSTGAYKLGQTNSIFTTVANVTHGQSNIKNIALSILFISVGLSLINCFNQRKQVADTQRMLDETRGQLNNRESELSRTRSSISSLQNRLRASEREVSVIQRRLTGCESELVESRSSVADLQNRLAISERERSVIQRQSIDREAELENVRASISVLQGSLTEYQVERGESLAKHQILSRAVDFCRGTELHFAVAQGWLRSIKELVNKGLDINAQDDLNRTPLMVACQSGHFPIFEYLLQLPEINLDLRDVDGSMLMHHAAYGGSIDILRLLHERGLDVDQLDYNLRTPLMAACLGGHYLAFEYFLRFSGNNLAQVDIDGATLMHHAAYGGNIDILRFLHERGLNINEKDYKGRTPFMVALENGLIHTIIYISKLHGIYCPREDIDGIAFEHYMVIGGLVDIIKSFVEGGFFALNIYDKNGHSPLIKALIYGRKEVVKYLLSQNVVLYDFDFYELLFGLKGPNKKFYADTFLSILEQGEKVKLRFFRFLEESSEDERREFLDLIEKNGIIKIFEHLSLASVEELHEDSKEDS